MDLMDIQDISYVDINELGVRPLNWTDDDNDLDYDETTNSYYKKEKLTDLQLLTTGKKLLNEEEGDIAMADEDVSNYEIDPETGEKTLREAISTSSPSLPTSNNKWIEEYLINIESSRAINKISSPTKTSDLLFEDIPFNSDQPDSNWLTRYLSLDESARNPMFPDQYYPEQYNNTTEKSLPQATSPIFIPSPIKPKHDSLINLLSVSIDDEHSISSSSNSSRVQRFYSSFENDSTSPHSELTFDGNFIETKLEKIEHDEHMISQIPIRRSMSRTNYQGQQDEEILRRYNIPLTLYDITQSTTEEYNRHLSHLNHLSPEQIHIIKDIRRRGKNKIAAQNCRKRKAINVETLLEEVDELKRVKHELEERKKSYQQQITETRRLYEYLHHQVLPDRQLLPAIIVK